MTKVVFAIDDQSMTGLKKFLRYADGIRVMNDVDIEMCLGYFENILEHSFICSNDDYEKYFQSFAKNQDSILVIQDNNHTDLIERDGNILPLGKWKQTNDVEGLKAWTYKFSDNTYWIAA